MAAGKVQLVAELFTGIIRIVLVATLPQIRSMQTGRGAKVGDSWVKPGDGQHAMQEPAPVTPTDPMTSTSVNALKLLHAACTEANLKSSGYGT